MYTCSRICSISLRSRSTSLCKPVAEFLRPETLEASERAPDEDVAGPENHGGLVTVPVGVVADLEVEDVGRRTLEWK